MRVSVRPALGNILLFAGSVVCLLVALELSLRVTGFWKVPPLNPPIYQVSQHPEISYELVPSHSAVGYGERVTTNALGFRSPELPEGSRPLVLLGDSLVFGYGVEDDETVGAFLQPFVAPPVLSAGVSGYNIRQERALYAARLKALHPAALVLVFMSNDMDETYALDADGYLYHPSRAGSYGERMRGDAGARGAFSLAYAKAWLQSKSVVVDFLEKTTKGLPLRSRSAAADIREDSMSDEALAAYARELRLLAREAGDVPKMFVVWPEQNLRLKTRGRLKPLAESLGFSVVDLYDAFGNAYESLGWDGHPSAATLQKTAALLAEAMRADSRFAPLLAQ